MLKLFLLFFFYACISTASAKLKVATLHPLLTDIASQVGKQHVEVVNLMAKASDAHSFSPSVASLRKAHGAKVYLAAGKGLESYLPKLRKMIPQGTSVFEVGKGIKSIVVEEGSNIFACCPKHAHGAMDPHWWHSVANIMRATQLITSEFVRLDGVNAKAYKANAAVYRKQLGQLNAWVKQEVRRIPRSGRYLATSHAAFGYFCKEYGFKSIPVQGLNAENDVTIQYLAKANSVIREKKIKAVFAEVGNNVKELNTIAKATGAIVGGALYADGHNSVMAMYKHNVTTIVKGLSR